MTRPILILLFMPVLISGTSISQSPSAINSGPKPSWRRYTVKGEEFSVKLPAYPVMLNTKVQHKGDGKERLKRRLQAALGKVYFIIEIYENSEPKQSLEQFIADEGLNKGYDIATERLLTIDHFAGIEYVSPNKNYPTIVQFFSTEDHVYSFKVGGAGATGKAREYFSSIKLGKKTDGLEVVEGTEPPATSEIGERIYLGKDVDTKARVLSKPDPIYPEEARIKRTQGIVVLNTIFARTGHVVNIHVTKGLPDGLTEAAIDAAKKITFTPAMKHGEPVSMWIQLEYRFNY